ncbi:adenylyltransferase/cytidyltransferase family protein [Pseudomonas luteola]
MKQYELAVYGGAFNPPHPGHKSVIDFLLSQAEKVVIVPSFKHPFAKKMADYELRLKWSEIMIRPYSKKNVSVSDAERYLGRSNQPIYSIDLLRHLRQMTGIDGKAIALVMGEDNEKIFPQFQGYQSIVDEFSVLFAQEILHLHSTMIRDAIKLQDSIPESWIIPGINPSEYEVFKETALA